MTGRPLFYFMGRFIDLSGGDCCIFFRRFIRENVENFWMLFVE